MLVASRQMHEKRSAQAVRTIGPLAYHPHAGADDPAVAMLERAREELAAQSVSQATAR
jgi:hypothetical protein